MTIKELAENVKDVVEYDGEVVFEETRLDGAPRKLMNIDLLKRLGWKAKTNLRPGLITSYNDYLLKYVASKDNKV